MSLEIKVMTELKAAMIAKNEAALRGLRAIKAAILLAKTSEGQNSELTEEDETKLLQKLVKQRKDSLEMFESQNRADLAQKEKDELDIIEKFMPKQMDESELRIALKELINKIGASGPGDMGKVMGVATMEFAGKAEGRMISTLVKEILNS